MKESINLTFDRGTVAALNEIAKSLLRKVDAYHPYGLSRAQFLEILLPEKNREFYRKWLSGDGLDIILGQMEFEDYIMVIDDKIYLSAESFNIESYDPMTISLEHGNLMEWRLIWEK